MATNLVETALLEPTPLPTDRLWTVEETAYFVAMSTSWVRRSALPYIRLGGGRRYRPQSVIQFVEQRSSKFSIQGAR